MISQSRTRLAAAVLVASLIPACAARQENLASLGPEELYGRAQAAYEEREWDLAQRILEYFVGEHVAHPSAPDARMLLGDVFFTRRDFPTAATHYQRLLLDFPSNPRALEARFKICDAYYRLSPRPPLDQQYTRSALDHCELIAESFAGTQEATDAATRVAELRNKLAKKAYDNGVFYFRRGAFDAAVVYLDQVLTEFPATPSAPAALGQLIETYERMGYVEDAAAARERLRREYPESAEAQELPS